MIPVTGFTATGLGGCFHCDIKGLGAESSVMDEHFAAAANPVCANSRATLAAVRL